VRFFGNISTLCLLLYALTAKAQEPEQRLTFQLTKFEARVAGKVDDTIKRLELLNTENIDFKGEDKYQITGFECKITAAIPYYGDSVRKYSVNLYSNSDRFTDRMIDQFQCLFCGSEVEFTNITCKGPDRTTITLNDVKLAITDKTPFSYYTRFYTQRNFTKLFVAGEESGKIKRSELLAAGKMTIADSRNEKILSYRVKVKTKLGWRSKLASDEDFTAQIYDLIKKAKPGSKVIFRSIKLLSADGTIRKYHNMEFKLRRNWFFKTDV
jgi:hypothetical protein